MTELLHRFTTEYIPAEDRIRISGAVENAAPVVVWVTQRLLRLLLPRLLSWLDKPSENAERTALMQSFAQDAAKAAYVPLPPVQAGTEARVLLAHTVQMKGDEQNLQMRFVAVDGQEADIVLAPKPMRQWLAILHDLSVRAEWPQEYWPRWIREERSAEATPPPTALH